MRVWAWVWVFFVNFEVFLFCSKLKNEKRKTGVLGSFLFKLFELFELLKK